MVEGAKCPSVKSERTPRFKAWFGNWDYDSDGEGDVAEIPRHVMPDTVDFAFVKLTSTPGRQSPFYGEWLHAKVVPVFKTAV